jgi:hypothetical protein
LAIDEAVMTRIIAALLACGAFCVVDGLAHRVAAQAGTPNAAPALPSPQPVPAQPPGAGTTPPEEVKPRDNTLSDTLSRRDGVLPPPQSGQGMVVRPPATGTMPVIPPPGTPGGNQQVNPK